MNFEPFKGPGSTPKRRAFWEQALSAVKASQKLAGRHVSVEEHPGKGTVINIADARRRGATGACCDAMGGCTITTEAACTGTFMGIGTVCDPNPCPCASNCDSLPPIGAGPPSYISITKTVSGTCSGGTQFSGTFHVEGALSFADSGGFCEATVPTGGTGADGHRHCTLGAGDDTFNLDPVVTLIFDYSNVFGHGPCTWVVDFFPASSIGGTIGPCTCDFTRGGDCAYFSGTGIELTSVTAPFTIDFSATCDGVTYHTVIAVT